jgi:uncharacterized protein (TIGR03067 family)
MRPVMLLLLVFALPDRPDLTPREKPKTPQEMFLADWVYISSTADGVGPANPHSVWRVTPTEAIWLNNGQRQDANTLTSTYKIDWATTPVSIDLFPKQGGQTIRGILRMEGDRMVMALTIGGEKRPIDFQNASWVHSFRRK